MRYPGKMLEHIVQAADLHGEAQPLQPLVEIFGDKRVLIENHKGVIGYNSEEIRIKVNIGCVCVNGTGLTLLQMTREHLVINGCIHSVCLQRGGKR